MVWVTRRLAGWSPRAGYRWERRLVARGLDRPGRSWVWRPNSCQARSRARCNRAGGKVRLDPGYGPAGGVAGAQEADAVGVYSVVAGGVADQVGQGLVEAEQRPHLLTHPVGVLGAGHHILTATQVGLDRVQHRLPAPPLVVEGRDLLDRRGIGVQHGGDQAEQLTVLDAVLVGGAHRVLDDPHRDRLPIALTRRGELRAVAAIGQTFQDGQGERSEEHTSELQSP